jgi:hypothetical protein
MSSIPHPRPPQETRPTLTQTPPPLQRNTLLLPHPHQILFSLVVRRDGLHDFFTGSNSQTGDNVGELHEVEESLAVHLGQVQVSLGASQDEPQTRTW